MTNLAYPRSARTDYPDSTAVTHDTSDHRHDFVGHHLPQLQLHHLAVHDWGIARGLEVSASGSTLTVQPGVAIDQQGRLIVLASGGYGNTGANPLAGQHNPVRAPVSLFTGNLGGDTVYVTIRFAEVPQSRLPAPDTGPAERLEQAPWLRLRTRAELDGDVSANIPFLVLAIADIDQNGRVVALRTRNENDTAEQQRRRLLGERVERLAFDRTAVDGMTIKTLGVADITLGDDDVLRINAPQTTVGGALRVNGASTVGPLTADQVAIGISDASPHRLRVEGDVHIGGALTVTGLLQGNLAGDLVNTAQLRDGAVTAVKLQAGSVGVIALADSAVTTLKVADAAITAAKIASDAVASAHLQNGAVAVGKVADSAITEAALANNAVTTAKIQDDAVSSNKLADLAVTGAKLAANSVAADKLQDGSVVAGKLASGAVTTAKLADNAIQTAKLQDGSVVTNKLADAAITPAKLANGAVTNANLADGAVTTAKLANNTVTAAKIQDGSVGTAELADGAVTFAKLAAGVLPREVGIAVGTGLKNGQSIPIPSGFTKEECVFFATFKLIVIPTSGTSVHCLAQPDGTIAASPEDAIVVTGVAIAKKGGW